MFRPYLSCGRVCVLLFSIQKAHETNIRLICLRNEHNNGMGLRAANVFYVMFYAVVHSYKIT